MEIITVEPADSYEGQTLLGLTLKCNFPLWLPGLEESEIKYLTRIEELVSQDFLRVFKGCTITCCKMTGTDCPENVD